MYVVCKIFEVTKKKGGKKIVEDGEKLGQTIDPLVQNLCHGGWKYDDDDVLLLLGNHSLY